MEFNIAISNVVVVAIRYLWGRRTSMVVLERAGREKVFG